MPEPRRIPTVESNDQPPAGASGAHVEDLLAEAALVLREAKEQGDAVYETAEAEPVGQLLRSVHSYKSLMAFAGRRPQAEFAEELERYLRAIWQERISLDREAQVLTRRGLSVLQALHQGATEDLSQSAREIAHQMRAQVEAAPAALAPVLAGPSTRRRRQEPDRLPSRRLEPTAQLAPAELAEVAQIGNNLNRLLHRLRDLLPPGDERLDALVSALLISGEKLTHALHRHRFASLRAFLLPTVGAVREMAASQGKLARVRLEVDNVEVDKPLLQVLRPGLLHLLRNAVAHGIESPEARVAAGKPEEGCITIAATVRDGWLHLTVKDDGSGFDVNALRSTAISSGALSPERAACISDTEAALLALIPGLSTRTEPDGLSGNGVGLTVVAEDVSALGGTVGLDSRPGQYSAIHLSVPLPSAATGPATRIA
ncbi:MAG: hypothetical protein HPY83_19415 [Anaerolineae bacterium]|nr:hypothetical protein [Anaerolineae bacterium]